MRCGGAKNGVYARSSYLTVINWVGPDHGIFDAGARQPRRLGIGHGHTRHAGLRGDRLGADQPAFIQIENKLASSLSVMIMQSHALYSAYAGGQLG